MLRRLLLTLLATMAALGAFLGGASPALAHNTLVSSDPATGSTVAAAPTQITLVFDKPVPLDTVSVELIDATGVRSDLTGSTHGPEGDTHVVTPLPALSPGAINLRWRLVGPDGHPITGRISFTIAAAATTVVSTTIAAAPVAVPALDPTATTTTIIDNPVIDNAVIDNAIIDTAIPSAGFSEPWVTTDASRWLLRMVSYLAIMVIGGVVASALFVWRHVWEHLMVRRATAVSIGVAAAASFTQLLVIASDISADPPWQSFGQLSAALETDAGVALVVRLILLGVATVLLFAPLPSIDSVRWKASAGVTLVLLGTWAYAGHAQSMRWPLVGIPLDVAHHAAAAAWLGGLAIVGVVATRTAAGAEVVGVVQRFGKLAAISVGVIVATGLVQAVRLVGSPMRLFDADHGQYLVAKLVILGIMLKVADVNRRRVERRFREVEAATPRLAGILRRAMGTELVVGLAVVGITAAMVVSPPAIAQSDESVPVAAADLAVADGSTADPAALIAATTTSLVVPAAIDTTTSTVVAATTCAIGPDALAIGSAGNDVVCLQNALRNAVGYAGGASGVFDEATDAAVRAVQEQNGLYVDGIVGEQTATALDIWAP